MAKKYYAVKAGRAAGIYETWDECKANVHGYPGALFKSFPTREAAAAYLDSAAETIVADNAAGYNIYVDGSYDKTAAAYGWGFAVYQDGELVHTASGRGTDAEAAKTHNVAGELAATVNAVQWALDNNIKPVIIHHDYSGIAEWAQRRWKTNNKITGDYAAFMQPHCAWVRFNKVAGHTGVPGNELADKLAKQALAKQ